MPFQSRPISAGAQTPIDMKQSAEVARRIDVPAAVAGALSAERFGSGKVTIGGRRGIVDLPSLGSGSGGSDPSADSDLDLNSAFDVPAFLRRQEG